MGKKEEEESLFTKENRERKALVTLGGTAITESGKLTKSNYFRFLEHNLDEYDHIELTADEAKKIHTHLQKLSTGATAMVPLYCAGEKCPFASRCPLQQMKKAPIGKQCPIEVNLMREWIMRYFEEFDVDPNNFTEIGFINELADLMVQEMRVNMLLARPENQELLIDQVIGVDRDGDPIVQKNLTPFIDMKDKISARRSKIIKLMVGDRQEKYKKEAALKIKLDTDPSNQMAALRSKLENLKRELDTSEKKAALSPEDLFDEE